jgi:hypothetical protein
MMECINPQNKLKYDPMDIAWSNAVKATSFKTRHDFNINVTSTINRNIWSNVGIFIRDTVRKLDTSKNFEDAWKLL